MKKVSEVVRDILFASEPELTVFSKGALNLSAYAKRIQPEVARRAQKSVQLGTIVVALSRLSSEILKEDPLFSPIKLNGIAVKTSLAEIAFNKTKTVKTRAQAFYSSKVIDQADFFTITYGAGEISIFAPMAMSKSILKSFQPEKPKLYLEGLAALTVHFDEVYLETPNMYFSLLRTIAVRRINIVELISTYTELTFLIAQSDINELFSLINDLMRQPSL